MIIQHNIPGMNNTRIGKGLNDKMSKAMRRLSTGTRVATAADDAAGLAVSEKIRMLFTEQNRCITNTEEGVGVAQTADAALEEVSAMMHRAQQLCVQAMNDTYSDEDRAHISNEVNKLYDEMDRIFKSATFNTLKLFNADGYNPVGEDSIIREYTETVTEVVPGTPMELWGGLDFVEDKPFELADEATPASVTMKLDNEVKLNDASSLDGKSFTMKATNGDLVKIIFSADPDASTGDSKDIITPEGSRVYEYTISTTGCTTVQDAVDRLVNFTNNQFDYWNLRLNKDNTKLNAATRELTLAFHPADLVQNINGSTYLSPDNNGELSNSIVVSNSQEPSLGQIDGNDSVNNAFSYSQKASAVVEFLSGKSGALSDEDIAALANNTLSLTDGPTITFDAASLAGQSAESVRASIISQINDADNYTAAYNENGELVVTRTDCPTDKLIQTSINETVIPEEKTSSGISASVAKVPATGEKGVEFTVTLGSITLPASININGHIWTFVERKDNMSYSQIAGNNTSIWTVDNASEVPGAVASLIRSYVSDVTTSVSGNTIQVTGKYATQDRTLTMASATPKYGAAKKIYIPYSEYRLSQVASIPLDLGQSMSGPTALSDLNGKGFSLAFLGDHTYYEFVTSPAEKTNDSAIEIDLTGCTSYEEIAKRIEAVLDRRFDAEVKFTDTGAMTLEFTTNYPITLTDGVVGQDGLFLNSAGTKTYKASGGTNATQPQTTIDFSKYTDRTFDELYGKGFRITCASCEGEFINIVFCHDADTAGIPTGEFPVLDTSGNPTYDSNGNPIMYTNYAIELKNMRNGADIANAIVDQLKPQLDHFTDVSAKGSVLTITDKRAGNLSMNGTPLRAEIISGVYTNFTYDVVVNEYVNQNAYIGDPGDGTTAYYGYCPIFVGSTDDGIGNWVVVHLPTLSLETLNLEPPRPDLADKDTIPDVLDRLNTAEKVIITARGQLGADQNRLEHAQKNLAVSAEQGTATYSTIKDADMAKEMMEMTKISILQNFQQATMSHIFENSSMILQLMR